MKTAKRLVAGWALLLAGGVLLFYVMPLYAAMSDSKAMTTAHNYWGSAAMIAKVRTYGDSNWTAEVGFASPGCSVPFSVVGSGPNTWDAAFASIPLGTEIGARLSGVVPFMFQTGEVIGEVASFQFKLDNVKIGPPLVAPHAAPWEATLSFDTSTVPDGFHVICGTTTRPDGGTSESHAAMIVVKQIGAPAAAPVRLHLAMLAGHDWP